MDLDTPISHFMLSSASTLTMGLLFSFTRTLAPLPWPALKNHNENNKLCVSYAESLWSTRIRLADLPGEKEQFSASMVGKKKTSNKNSLRSIRTKTHTSPTFKLLSLTKGDQPLSNRDFEFLRSYLNLTDQVSPSDTLRMAIPTGSLIRCLFANSYGKSWEKKKQDEEEGRTDSENT